MVVRRIAAKGILHLLQMVKSLGMEWNHLRSLKKTLTDLPHALTVQCCLSCQLQDCIFTLSFCSIGRGVGAGRKGRGLTIFFL